MHMFKRMMIGARFAMEGHENQTPGIKRRHQRGNNAQGKSNLQAPWLGLAGFFSIAGNLANQDLVTVHLAMYDAAMAIARMRGACCSARCVRRRPRRGGGR